MYILHIETSTKVCSVAVSDDRKIIGCMDEMEGMNHTSLLAPMISKLLKSLDLRPKDLGAVSVSSGPGSYTGLRVGSSTAKAMSYSLEIPLISVPTLFSLAWAARETHPGADYFLPMLDARRNEVYTAFYNRDLSEIMPVSSLQVEVENLGFIPIEAEVICCGDGAFKMKAISGTPPIRVDEEIKLTERNLIGPAFEQLIRKNFQSPLHFVPFYLKPPNITQPRIIQ